MTAWLAMLAAVLLLLALMGWIADALESPEARDARERNR